MKQLDVEKGEAALSLTAYPRYVYEINIMIVPQIWNKSNYQKAMCCPHLKYEIKLFIHRVDLRLLQIANTFCCRFSGF